MSPAPRPPSFYRGKEGKLLLVLAGIMAVGWPSVLYFGYAKARNPAPKPTPIVNLPPLPPPDADPAFAGLRDKQPSQLIDAPAKVLAFQKIREHPEQLDTASRGDITPLDLDQRPKRYRGLPIRLEGHARMVLAHDDDDPSLAPIKKFYEVWMTVPSQNLYPCCVLTEKVPDTLPGGKDLAEPIRFEGYFLKLLSYRAGDRFRFAPMLVGRITQSTEVIAAREGRSIWWTIWPIVLIIPYLAFRIGRNLYKVRAQPRIQRDYFAQIERPEVPNLEHWLSNPVRPSDESESADE